MSDRLRLRSLARLENALFDNQLRIDRQRALLLRLQSRGLETRIAVQILESLYYGHEICLKERASLLAIWEKLEPLPRNAFGRTGALRSGIFRAREAEPLKRPVACKDQDAR